MNVKSEAEMQFKITLELTESEARALNELTKYGAKAFLEVFYTHLGKSGLQPFENGVKALFNTASTQLPQHFNRIDKTRKVFTDRI